jgi:phage-related minor tail protein
MGEEGPEAIMPLKRGPDGKLGVAGAGGGRSVQNNYNVEINIGSVDSNERAAALQRELRNTIIATTRETMVKEQRKGGLLNPVGAR